MLEMAEVRLSARCTYRGDCPVENVMSSTGSLMKLAPTLNSCRPLFQVKSSRNWNLCCSVVCGVLTDWPTYTPLGKLSVGSVEFSEMWFRKYENWNVNSLSLPPPSTEFRFAFAEWKVFLLMPQF